jgi:hypothetical protein
LLSVTKGPCVTERLLVFGSHDWSPNLHIKAVQSYGLAAEVAQVKKKVSTNEKKFHLFFCAAFEREFWRPTARRGQVVQTDWSSLARAWSSCCTEFALH